MSEIGPMGGAGWVRDPLPRKPAVPAAPPIPRIGPPVTTPISQGTFRAVPRREVQTSPNPQTGTPEFQIVVVNGIVMHVPPDGWLA